MSEIKVNSIKGVSASTAAISIDNSSGTCTANITNNLSNRRLNINGAFQVMQRGTQSSVTAAKYGIDRWKFEVYNCGTWTLSQDTDVPSGKGFSKSYKIQCTTADASPAASDYVDTRYRFEGQDLQMLQWGTSDAKPLTVSFWIKCKKTGTFNLNLLANGAANKSLGKVITISAADTWEYKSVTFAGDTAQAIISDNAARLTLIFWLDAGSSYKGGTSPTSAWETLTSANRAASTTIALADNTANYVNLCGLQIEAGSVATDFEHRSYAVEKRLCDRYYQKIINNRSTEPFGVGNIDGSTQAQIYVSLPVEMRTAPTSMEVNNNATDIAMRVRSNVTCTGFNFFGSGTHNAFLEIQVSTGHGFTDGQAAFAVNNGANLFLAFSAEL
jgi:hypothetical protein